MLLLTLFVTDQFQNQGGYLGKTGTTNGGAVAWMVGYAGDYGYAFLLLGGQKHPDGVWDLRKRMVEALLRQAGALP